MSLCRRSFLKQQHTLVHIFIYIKYHITQYKNIRNIFSNLVAAASLSNQSAAGSQPQACHVTCYQWEVCGVHAD